MLVERLSQYPVADRLAMAATGLGPWPAVVLVVSDSPAAAAGLRPGDQITAVDGAAIVPEDGISVPFGPGAALAFDAQLDAALADGSAMLAVTRGGQSVPVTLTVPPGCAARFAVRLSDRLSSYSDGLTIQITWAILKRARTDAELASVVAHELAHNILRHPQQLKVRLRRAGQVRATELAADRLAVYLLAAAGYDYDAAIGFLTRILRKGDWGILSDGTHPGWRERVAAMAAEQARIAEQRARGEPLRPPPDLLPPG